MHKVAELSYVIIAFLILTSLSFAQAPSVDTALITTDVTVVDTATAASAARIEGAPVVVAENTDINEPTIADLKASGIKNIVIIGGPAVLKSNLEEKLKANGFTVVRLWGQERTGTALAVARYFWPAGAMCAVLVDDTKNSKDDARRLLAASNLASNYNCIFIPVPEGKLPAEVLFTLNDLNVKNVFFIGKRTSQEIIDMLKEFSLKEIVGDDNQIENSIEDNIKNTLKEAKEKPKLVIVATPDWKAAIGVGAHPNEHFIVKFVTSVDEVDAIITKIIENNITDVRIVGLPDLVQQIVDKLMAAGINVTKVSGNNANDIARELMKTFNKEWFEQKKESYREKIMEKSKALEFLAKELSKTEDELMRIELEAELTNIDELKADISALRMKITEIKNALKSRNIELAKRLIAEIRYEAKKNRYEYSESLKIDLNKDAEDEEATVPQAESKTMSVFSSIEFSLIDIRNKCQDSEIIDSIVNKAKLIRAEIDKAKANNDYAAIIEHINQLEKLIKVAKGIGEACRSRGLVPSVASDIAKKEGLIVLATSDNFNKSFDNFNKSSDNFNKSFSSSSKTWIIEITDNGYVPRELEIKTGDSVTWINKRSTPNWPASAVHPTHEVYPGSSITKCSDPLEKTKIFDACKGLEMNESFTFTFNEKGTWRYHDHISANMFGLITVE